VPIIAASTVELARTRQGQGHRAARVRLVSTGEDGWLTGDLGVRRFKPEGGRGRDLQRGELVEVFWPPQPGHRANPAGPTEPAPRRVIDGLLTLASQHPELRGLSRFFAVQERDLAAAWVRHGPPELREAPATAEAFTGGGLYSLALHCEGADVWEVCEIDADAVATLQSDLYPTARVCDATEWEPPPGLDLLTGGPPCQPWSKGGTALGPDDARNFYPRLVGWVERARPRVFAFENSDKITTNPRFRAYFDEWWAAMRAVGYEGVTWVLNAADFGSPQARKRAWVVGWPIGAAWGELLREPPPKTHGRPGSAAVERRELLPWTGAFDRLTSGCCGGYGLFDCKWLNNAWSRCETCFGAMGAYPANYEPASMTDDEEVAAHRLPYLAQLKGGRPRVFSHPPTPGGVAEAFDAIPRGNRVSGWLSPALVKNMQKGAPYGLITTDATPRATDVDRDDPEQMEAYLRTLRRIAPRSAGKLMDVPAWYEFWDRRRSGPESVARRQAAYRQIGNGITVNMGRVVARRIFAALGYSVPIKGSPAAEGRHGYWPMDTVDPCARFPGILGYPGGSHWPGSVPDKVDVDRWQRPLDGPEDWMRLQGEGEAASAGYAAWGGQEDTYQLDPDWRPAAADDHPPGFPDYYYFLQWLSGEDESLIEHFEDAWREAGFELGL